MSDEHRYRGDPEDVPDSDPGLVLAARLRGLEEDSGIEETQPVKRELTREERQLQQARLAAEAPAFDAGAAALGGESALAKPLTLVLVLLGVIVVGVIIYPYIFKPKSAEDAPTPVTGTSGSTTQAGSLIEQSIDEGFQTETIAAIEVANSALKDAGINAYVYRYGVVNIVDPGKSQRLTLRAYLGGPDAARAAADPDVQVFRGALQPYLDKLMGNQGVEALLLVQNTGGSKPPDPTDVYVRYGYDYGLEHMDDLQPIIDALKAYHDQEGQYPHTLDSNIAGTHVATKGGYFFEAEGFGYLPQFKTNSDGSIAMGSGGGIARYNPEACTGYYLVMYLESEKQGLDVHNPEQLNYYAEKIAPFPYQAPKGITNVVPKPDGQPDGIACVVKSGELLR